MDLTSASAEAIKTFVGRFTEQKGEVLFTHSWEETLGGIERELRRWV